MLLDVSKRNATINGTDKFFGPIQPIRIVACFDNPIANECFESYPWNCSFPGYEIEYIYTLINGMLKLPVQWLRVDSYIDVEAAMDNGTADIIGVSLSLSATYANRWGYLPAFLYDGVALISRVKYDDTSQPFMLMSSFTWDLWLAIAMITLTLIAIRWASSKLEKRRSESTRLNCSPMSILHYGMFAFRSRIWYAIWFVLLSVILNFYSNLIAVTIVAPSKVKSASFTTLQDLGEKLVAKTCQLIISDRYKDNIEILGSLVNPTRNDKTWQVLFRKAFVENPPIYVANREKMGDAILNSQCTVGVDWMTLDVYWSTNFCDINIISFPEELPLFGYTFYNLKHEIHDAIGTIIASNAFQTFTDYLTNKYYENKFPPDCSSSSKKAISDPTVPVSKVQDSFYMLGIGIALALVFISARYAKVLFNWLKIDKGTPSNVFETTTKNKKNRRVRISTPPDHTTNGKTNGDILFVQRKSIVSNFELDIM